LGRRIRQRLQRKEIGPPAAVLHFTKIRGGGVHDLMKR